MKKTLPILLLLFCSISFGQELINNYKYIIVPKQFDAFKNQNQYQTSTLVKFLFVNKGFNVIYEDELPPELSSNRCLGLFAELIDGSNMFTTKSSLVLKDCNSKEIFRTKEGLSKIKEYKAAYSEAIKEAFTSLSDFNYSYNQQTNAKPITISFRNDVKTLASEKSIPVIEDESVSEIATTRQLVNDNSSTKTTEPINAVPEKKAASSTVFYAQIIANGYQLVDSTPKIVMKIFKTSQPNIFLGEETNGTNGLVYNENGVWFFEFYEGETLKVKSLNIKF